MENRNIIDIYHYWTNEAINLDLDNKRHKFGVLCSNLAYDFNIATIIRNNNAFLAKEVFIYGRRHWDRRGAVGTQHYSHIKHIKEEKDLDLINGYTWVAIDNVAGAIPIDEYKWPENSLMCLGQEQIGLPIEIMNRCKDKVYIKQYGSVRSLNVGCASAIAMFSYCNQYGNSC